MEAQLRTVYDFGRINRGSFGCDRGVEEANRLVNCHHDG